MLGWGIRMPKSAFGYAGTKIWLLKQRVSGCMKKAFECLKSNLNAQESIRILKGLLHGGYPDAKNVYPNTDEAIRILEDSIRMPVTPRSRTTNNKSK